MTIWLPEETERAESPAYMTIADAIERDVARGTLNPGDRLPTHRRLARALNVTVGTVSRGYAEAERRGLTIGEVGRGTFVRHQPVEGSLYTGAPQSELAGVIDLSLSLPSELESAPEGRELAATMRSIAEAPDVASLLAYTPDTASPRHRAVAADALRRLGVPALADRVTFTVGVQHGLTVIASAMLRPGDTVLCGELTYPGARALAQMFGLRLRPVSLDEEGIVPDALEAACRADIAPAALYVVPNIQNPTGAVMSAGRREQIAEIADSYGVLVVEDDVHGFLLDDPPAPIASLIPERTVYATSLAKAVSSGLRTGILHAPEVDVPRLRAGVRSTLWMPPPLMVEITARWLEDGTAERLMAQRRVESRARQELAARELAGYRIQAHPDSLHLWLHLPEPWRSDELVGQARQRGVLVAGAEAFVVGRSEVPHAVRISLGRPRTREQLARGLSIIADILEGCTNPCATIL
ncbi:MAG: PLP-dependent aminotransferase family protein [Gemmatimonadota bacterium]